MLIAYSLIAYKMPWLPASWLALFALPAAHGVTVLARVLAEEVHRRIGYAGAAVLALVPALAITARSSFVRPADKIEQLAYVHTDADYNTWYGLIQAGAERLGDANITIAVDHDATWPLPYSLTPYPKTRWGATGDEDVIIVAVSRAAALDPKLTRLYLRRQYMLRDSAEPAFIYLRRSLYARILGLRGISKQFTVVGNSPGPAPSPAAVAAR
jgi:hypothetical protein